MSRCRSCKAPVVWARTTKGRSIPLDADDMGGWESPERFDDGNLRPTGDRARTAGGQTVMVVEVVPPETEGRHYRSHFTSCPDVDDWRKPRGAAS
jgi:hypothetical protein